MTLIRAMTFNVFSPDPLEEGEELPAEELPNSWEDRAALNLRTIKRYSPDLVGFQEMDRAKLETYREQLAEYSHELARGFDGIDEPDLWLPIFWKSSRFELVDAGAFWLSETPDVPSMGWDVPYQLGARWVRLVCLDDGSELLHLNTHLDDESALSRVESSKLIVERVARLQDGSASAILTGDFNCNPWHEPYRIFAEAGFVDTYRAAGHGDSAASSTFHGFHGERYFGLEWGGEVFWRVDWILTRDGAKRLQTTSSTIVRDAEPPVYPSDHYPVVSEVVLLS